MDVNVGIKNGLESISNGVVLELLEMFDVLVWIVFVWNGTKLEIGIQGRMDGIVGGIIFDIMDVLDESNIFEVIRGMYEMVDIFVFVVVFVDWSFGNESIEGAWLAMLEVFDSFKIWLISGNINAFCVWSGIEGIGGMVNVLLLVALGDLGILGVLELLHIIGGNGIL